MRPRALVALGVTAARSLLGRAVPILASRGRWPPRPDGRPVLITVHPSSLLRAASPEDRAAAFAAFTADLAHAREVLDGR